MTEEQKLNAWILGKLKRCDPVRIENSIGGGMPDINACHDGREVWIESKIYVGGRVLLRKEQYAWGIRRSMHAGRVYVIAKHPVERIYIWRHPFEVMPHGKYVAIYQAPMVIANKDYDLFTYLFT